MSKTPHVFISYPHAETDFATRLASDLKNSGLPIWIDLFNGIPVGEEWRSVLQDAIDTSIAMIAVLCPAYVSSVYCMNELHRADDRRIVIFPLLLREMERKEDYPLAIQGKQYIPFQKWENDTIYQGQLNRLVEFIRAHLLIQKIEISSEERYLNNLIASLETKKARGVLEYVDLRADSKAEIRPNREEEDEWGFGLLSLHKESQISSADSFEIQKLEFNNIREVLVYYPRFVLLGKPGAGKTTTIRRLARDMARQRAVDSHKFRLPILLYLPRWKEFQTFEQFIRSNILLDSDPIAKLLDRSAILFLDGLNEMGASGEKKLEEISTWLNLHNSVSVIVTCREMDYRGTFELINFPKVIIHDLNPVEIKKFVYNYLGESSEAFLNHILQAPKDNGLRDLLRLVGNPYMLSALIFVFQDSGSLPNNAGDLFRRLAKALWDRERKRATKGWIPFDEAEKAFGNLALEVIDSQSSLEFTLDFALRNIGGDRNLLDVGERASFIEIVGSQVHFFHQLILEYFAAVAWTEIDIERYLEFTDSLEIEEGTLIRIPSKWDRVIIALCGLTEDPDELISTIIGYDALLAQMCVETGIAVSDATKALLEQKLEEYNILLAEHDHYLYDNLSFESIVFSFAQGRIAIEQLQDISGFFSTEVIWLCDILINSLDNKRREVAAHILFNIYDDEAIPFLLQALRDKNWFVASAAANALLRVGKSRERNIVLEWYQKQNKPLI